MKNELQIKVEAILKEKQLTKVELAKALNLPKQNLNRIFARKNLDVIQKVANFLSVPLTDLTEENHHIEQAIEINGFLEINGEMFRIKNIEDFKQVASRLIH